MTATDVLEAAGRSVKSLADLAASEAHLAAMSALSMLFLTIVSAAAVVIGWSLLMAVVISLLADAGISWRISATVVAAVHAVAALACWELLANLSRNLTLPTLRRAITPRQRLSREGRVADEGSGVGV